MNKYVLVTGVGIPLGLRNIDTDFILPGRYLKTISRNGLGVHAFEELRDKPDNIFDTERNSGAPILIAGDNFGCGSSREHAPWALLDFGIRVVIAPSFADIFAGNAFKNGILLIALPQEQVDRLLEIASGVEITVDLEQQAVSTPYQDRFPFEIDPFRKCCLLEGLDEIGLTERVINDINGFEANLAVTRPWIAAAAGRAT